MPDETTPNQIPPGFKLRHTLRGHEQAISRIAWSPDGQHLASAGDDGTVRLWDIMKGQMSHSLSLHPNGVLSVAWSPDSRQLASVGEDGQLILWDIHENRLLRNLEVDYGPGVDVLWSPDGRTIATAHGRSILLWNVEEAMNIAAFEGHSESVVNIAWSPDGRHLASASNDGTVRLWDIMKGQMSRSFLVDPDGVSGVAWSPDGHTIASAGADCTLRVLNPESKETNFILEGHSEEIHSISFSFDGTILASKSADGTVRLWRCYKWDCVVILDEPSSELSFSGLRFHPKAPVLATLGEHDTVIRIWDLDFGVVLGAKPKEESVFYTTAKIALVGDSGVGKTGLGWRIAHKEFKEHPSTHGQQFWVIDELGAVRADKTQCEAVLWDLAGQPDYRLVHALFLDDVDLALVLFDPTNRQEPLKGVEYWLKQLSCAHREGRRRRVILVGARADRGTPTLAREELEEFCRRHGVEGMYLSTSAMTGEGMAELLERVRESIVWDEMPATVTTATFKRVKEFVLRLKEDGGREGVLVSPGELRARLEATDLEWEFSDAEMMTAVRHLANHGYVAVLRGSKGAETVLLVPDLLANLASSIVLEARRSPKELGSLDEARVLQGGYEFAELAPLAQDERDVLLDAAAALFLGHNLCFRESLGTQTFLVFPALINQKRPYLEEVSTVDDVSYQVSGAVENVYAALVVLLGYTSVFTRTNQWQNQAQYEMGDGEVCGFRQVAQREGEIELVLYYGATVPQHTRLLFEGLFEKFVRGRDVTVTKYPPVNCKECGYRQERAEVVKRIGAGKDFLFCNECGLRVGLPSIGEEVALTRRDQEKLEREQARARLKTAFETALVRVKAVARDEGKAAPTCFVSYAWGDAGRERWVGGLASDLRNAGVSVRIDQRDNAALGGSVARFISDGIERSDFVVVVGTPRYKEKYENKVSSMGSVVAAEVDLIDLRLTGTEDEKATVLPLLVEGDPRASLPPLMRGRVRGDFLQERMYFASLFDLVLTLYRIPFDHPAVSDLRESLRAGAERPR